MKVVSPGPRATPRGRRRASRAYARAVAAMVIASAIACTISWRDGWRRYWAEYRGLHGAERLIEIVGYDFHQPLAFALDDYLLARLTYEPILAVLVIGLLCTLVLERRWRRSQ